MMNKIISKINILIFFIFLTIPSVGFAQYFSAETLMATNITTNSVNLSGNVSFDEGLASTRFDYGINRNLEENISGRNLVGKYQGYSQSVSVFLGQLKSNTTYFYRICLESNVYGEVCGEIKSFRTKSEVKAPVVSSISNTSSNSNNSSLSSAPKNNNQSNSEKTNNSKKDTNTSQSASVVNASEGGNFLPDTFLEWILAIALIFFIIMFGRYLYLKRQEEIEEEKRREIEMQLRGQVV